MLCIGPFCCTGQFAPHSKCDRQTSLYSPLGSLLHNLYSPQIVKLHVAPWAPEPSAWLNIACSCREGMAHTASTSVELQVVWPVFLVQVRVQVRVQMP